jgi:hypothetical protein
MSERKKYTVIVIQPRIYKGKFYAHSQTQALKLAEKEFPNSYPQFWEKIESGHLQYKITEDK